MVLSKRLLYQYPSYVFSFHKDGSFLNIKRKLFLGTSSLKNHIESKTVFFTFRNNINYTQNILGQFFNSYRFTGFESNSNAI